MQQAPHYKDVVAEVKAYLAEKVLACVAAGIARDKLVLDPGFGFGKNLQHNLTLMAHLGELSDVNLPLLVCVSRKRMIGETLDKPIDQRLYGGLALATLAVAQGAHILRVHDVAPTVDALKMASAVLQARKF